MRDVVPLCLVNIGYEEKATPSANKVSSGGELTRRWRWHELYCCRYNSRVLRTHHCGFLKDVDVAIFGEELEKSATSFSKLAASALRRKEKITWLSLKRHRITRKMTTSSCKLQWKRKTTAAKLSINTAEELRLDVSGRRRKKTLLSLSEVDDDTWNDGRQNDGSTFGHYHSGRGYSNFVI